MEQKHEFSNAARLNFLLFFATLVIVGALFFVLPKPSYSTYEKRELTKAPAFSFEMLFSGKLTKGFEAYYADVFPLRERLVQVTAQLENLRGIRGSDDVKLYD